MQQEELFSARQLTPPCTAAVVAKKNVVSISADALLSEAATLMRENHIGDLVVVEKSAAGERPVGILTDRDIMIQTLPKDQEAKTLLVADIMTSTLAVARENEDIFAMADTMKNCGVSRLPVVNEQGHLIGIVTAKTLIRVLTQALSDLANLSRQQQQNEKQIRH